MKKLITVPRVLSYLVLLFIILHVTPSLSLRTHLVFTGHPKLAFTAQIEDLNYNNDNKRIGFYSFNPSPVDRATGNTKLAYKTTKIGFIYLTTYHGGG